MEIWETIDEFPDYSISNWGRVSNDRTGRILVLTQNDHETVMVGLTHKGRQHKRSVAVLVANAFLAYPYHELFRTPIHLDGDRTNNHADNLAWRPLWFAQMYHQQFKRDYPNRIHVPIEVINTGEVYNNSLECAQALGVLERDLVLAVLNEDIKVFPTDYEFKLF